VHITHGKTPYNILWSSGDTTAEVNNLCPGDYFVTVTDKAGSLFQDTITITSPVELTVNVNSPRTTICADDSVTISAPAGFNAYAWNVPGADSILTTNMPGSYYVTITDAQGCKVESNHLSITVNPLPRITITVSDSIFCSNDSTESCTIGGFSSYKWNTGQTSACISITQAGNYYVTVGDANNCFSESNHIPVSVYPVPSVAIIVHNDTLTSYGAVAYQWYYNSQLIEGATNESYLADSTGDYSVEITNNNGCKESSIPVFVAVAPTGIKDITAAKVQVYPNPLSSGNWQLSVGSELIGSYANIYDAAGRLIYSQVINNQRSQIELEAASGIYMLRIVAGDTAIATKKLVKGGW
jgi:hypothetical protein